jgi:hypothetical protein
MSHAHHVIVEPLSVVSLLRLCPDEERLGLGARSHDPTCGQYLICSPNVLELRPVIPFRHFKFDLCEEMIEYLQVS